MGLGCTDKLYVINTTDSKNHHHQGNIDPCGKLNTIKTIGFYNNFY